MGAHTGGHSYLPTLQEQTLGDEANESAGFEEHGMSADNKKRKDQRAKGTGCIFKPKSSKYWYIAYMSGGKRRYESAKSVLKSDAQRLLSQRVGDTARGVVVTPQVGKLSMWDGLKAVIDRQRQDARRSIAHTERRIQLHILKFFASARLMASVTTGDIEDYITHRLGQGAKPASVNRELAILRQAFRRAVRGGRLLAQPEIKLLAENNVREVFWERDEFAALIELLPQKYPENPEYVPVLQFACATGWRLKSEVLPMKVSQVNLAEGIVTLPIGSTKSGKGRIIPLTQEMRRILTQQLESVKALKKEGIICPYVFHRQRGKKRGWQIKSMRTSFKEACAAINLPDRTFHDFRKTGTRDMVRAGNSEAVTMMFTGHKTRAVFDRYNITSLNDMRVAAARMDVYAKQPMSDAQGSDVVEFKKKAAK